jgi:hypothetical protein
MKASRGSGGSKGDSSFLPGCFISIALLAMVFFMIIGMCHR